MSPRPPTPPGANELGISDDWKNGRTAVQILFVLLSIVAGAILTKGSYFPIAAVSAVLLGIPYFGRWRTDDSGRRVMMLALAWPAALLVSWYIVMNEERWRKERIIYDVMES